MSTALRLLLVEDSEPDASLICAELRQHGYALLCERVQTEAAFRSQLGRGTWDLIIADYRLPGFSALGALQVLQEKRVDLPFIIVSGTIGEEVAVAAMKAGAHDYVMKGKLARLVPAVERELRDAQVRCARAQADEDLAFQADLLRAVGQAVVATDAQGTITYWNGPAEALYGWPAAKAVGCALEKLVRPQDAEPSDSKPGREHIQDQNWFGERVFRRSDGTSVVALVTNSPIYDAVGQVRGMIQVATDVTARKQAQIELQNSREQLRALALKLQLVREEERKGLSRDIHDELGQVLTGLKMELAWMRSRLSSSGAVPRKALLEKIAELGAQIDASANGIRKLCSELRPGILDDLGLAAAIEWQAREFSKRTGIQCDLTIDPEGPALDPDGNTAVFRIFQEILTNVARHAQARKLVVRLGASQALLTLEAHDDGRGIRPEELKAARSLGLLGMRERAMALGGSIEFVSASGGGTTVRLSVPLKIGQPLTPSEGERELQSDGV